MAGRNQAARLARRRGLLVLGSSAAAAAALSATRLIRQRATQRERRYAIDPERPAGPELRRVLAGQLDLAREELSDRTPDGEAIHETRKALKRSRAALRVGRHLLGRDSFEQENRTLRDAGRALSDARDAEVREETVQSLSQDAGRPMAAEAGNRVVEVAVPEPSSDPKTVQREARSGISEARDRVADWPLPEEDEPAPLAPGLKRIYRQGRRALAQARKNPGDERWHELRKRTKDLWYAAQLLEASRPKRMRKLVKRARRLSKLLGEDHDLAVLEQRLTQQSDQLVKSELKLIRRLIKRRRRKLQRQAEVRARRLYRRKPGRFIRRLGVR